MPKMTLLVCALCFAGTVSAAPVTGNDASTKPNKYYLTSAETVDSVALIPPPPMPVKATDPVNDADRIAYEEGLKMRTGKRGRQAVLDADSTKVHLAFQEAFGVKITKEDTPQLYRFIKHLRRETGSLATRGAKQKYNRIRPFVYYNQPTCYKDDEARLSKDGGYPSGHSARGWAVALILAEVNPDNKDAILQRGIDMGRSRVICGYHWASDVENARLIGAANVAALHANPRFMKDLNEVKAEFAALKKAGKVTFHNKN
ncbi:MAG TPA: phosphatase PAP2 family protein [Sutterella sp.]|nr:phosphatase PAP2 family protein [Sutterella sp.]